MTLTKLKSAARYSIFALFLAALPAVSQQNNSQDPWEWQNRDKWQEPEEVMNELRLKEGSKVADVGCGSGYFTFHLAERVGPQGKVYAVDIQPDLIRQLWHQSLSKWLVQVRPVLGEVGNPRLPSLSLDATLLVHSYHEMREHDAIVNALYLALKPGGLLGIIEFLGPDEQPREESYKLHQIPPHTVQEEVTGHGFLFVGNEQAFDAPGFNKKQYFLLFKKPEG